MIRAQVPGKFKPNTASAAGKVLQIKGEPIKVDKAVLKTPEAKIEVKLDQPVKEAAPPIKTEFKKIVETKSAAETRVFVHYISEHLYIRIPSVWALHFRANVHYGLLTYTLTCTHAKSIRNFTVKTVR